MQFKPVVHVLCLVAQLCPSLVTTWTVAHQVPVQGDSPCKNTGVGCCALLQGTFPTQGLNLGLPQGRWILYRLSHQRSPPLHISSVQSLSCVRLFATRWTAACQVSLSITNSWSLLKLMPIESVISSNHLILCHSSSPPTFSLSQHQSLFQWVVHGVV